MRPAIRALRSPRLALGRCAPAAAVARRSLVTSISATVVKITSTYTGAELVVFGVIERDGREGDA